MTVEVESGKTYVRRRNMNKTLTLAAMLVCVLAVTAGAQGGAERGGTGKQLSGQGILEPAEEAAPEQGMTAPSGKPATGGQAAAAKVETLTGCLQKGDEPNTFLLTNASSKTGAKLDKVELVGAPKSVKLQEHVGHKVEVEAQPVGTQAAVKLEGGAEKTGGGKMEHAKAEQHFQVKSVHHLASSCS
jgi:hypothetical protein